MTSSTAVIGGNKERIPKERTRIFTVNVVFFIACSEGYEGWGLKVFGLTEGLSSPFLLRKYLEVGL